MPHYIKADLPKIRHQVEIIDALFDVIFGQHTKSGKVQGNVGLIDRRHPIQYSP
jgi:hypothetical protein